MDPILLQKQIRDNAQDVQNYMLDLKSWEEEMKRKEQQLHGESVENEDESPVRIKEKKSSADGHAEKEDSRRKDKPEKIPSYDYAAWDRFDADKACKLMDREEEYKVLKEHHGKTSKFATENKLRDEAYYEKEMGNKFVKQLKWNEALECYTRAIERYSFDAIFYANRALCHLKLGNFKAAEADCSVALELDSAYVKAYQRRATARIQLQLFQEARSDLQNVLQLEPDNSFVKEQLSELDQKLAEIERIQEREEKSIKETRNHTGQHAENQNAVLPIFKPPHLRSKKPLKHIEIKEVNSSSCGEHGMESQMISEDNACMNTISLPDSQNKDNIEEETARTQKGVDNNLDGRSDIQVPPVPASSIQFINTWSVMKNKPEKRFHYLKQIPGDKIPSIFRESMESSMLSEIITTLMEDFLQHEAPVYPFLKGLSEVKRFGALTMFLSKSDKSALEKLLDHCEANNECTAEAAAHLRNKYEL